MKNENIGVIKSEDLVYTSPAFKVTSRQVVNPVTGEELTRDVVTHAPVVIIASIDVDEEVSIITREFRAGVNEVTTGLPAGFIDEGETPTDAAIREFKEETGYTAKNVIELGEVNSSEGFTDEVAHLMLVTFDSKEETTVNFDDGEFVETELIPVGDLIGLAMDGTITSAQCVSAILRIGILDYNEMLEVE